MEKRVKEVGEIIKKSKQIHIVSHIDADGISAGSIAYKTLERLGKSFSIEFIKELDKEIIERLKIILKNVRDMILFKIKNHP